MPAMKLGIGCGALALLLGFTISPSQAQGTRRGPPIIRIYSDNGVDYVGTTSYITPRIDLSENAYVFAVEMDMDGEIQVLHPDFPGISVRIAAHKSLRLPNFFVGFNSSRYGGASYANFDQNNYGYYGVDDSRGTVIALASRAPFNLEKIEIGGDWDIVAIRRLIANRHPLSAANELARYLGQQGEPIGRDYLRFDGGGGRYSYPYASAYAYYSPCSGFDGYGYGPSLAFRQLQTFAILNRLRSTGRGVRLVGYDICGMPIYTTDAVNGGTQTPIGHFPRPRNPGDTTVFPKSRVPRSPVPRGSTVFTNADEANLPVTRRGGLPQMGDVTVKAAPTGRRAEPRDVYEDYAGRMSAPQGRIPVERVIVPRGAATGGSAQTVPEYRREPRAESAPARAPDRPRESPPQVIHERPSTPPPPPPRAEAPATKSEPARTPPPRGNRGN